MENASKALLIAGAILICILLIAIGMYIYNSAQSTVTTAAAQMGQQEKEIYNATVKKYLGNNKRGSEVKQMIEDIITHNNQNVGESGKYISIYTEGTIAGFTTTQVTALNSANENANVYDNASKGENNQTNIDAASKLYRELSQKISAGKAYTVSEKSQDGIIYRVTIKDNSAASGGNSNGNTTP